jgi:hypothetical protein
MATLAPPYVVDIYQELGCNGVEDLWLQLGHRPASSLPRFFSGWRDWFGNKLHHLLIRMAGYTGAISRNTILTISRDCYINSPAAVT